MTWNEGNEILVAILVVILALPVVGLAAWLILVAAYGMPS